LARTLAPLALVPLALLLAAPLPARADEAWKDSYELGLKRYQKGELEDAADLADAALADAPTNVAVLTLYRLALESQGDYEEAGEALEELAAEHKDAYGPALVLADHLRERDAKRAETYYRRALLAEPGRPAASVGLAEVLLGRGERSEAAVALKKAFSWYRDASAEALDAPACRVLARAALAAESIEELRKEHVRPFAEEARTLMQRAYDLEGSSPDLLAQWAQVYLSKSNFPEARKLLKKGLEVDPRHARSNALLAESLLDDLYGGTQKYDTAREALATALGRNPQLSSAHVLKAELEITDALYQEALTSYDAGLTQRPDWARALGGKAGVLQLLERHKEAKTLLDGATDRLGATQSADLYRHLARTLDQKFRYKEAYAAAKRATELDPSFWPAYTQLGLAAMRVGREAEARTYLEKAHEADPFDLYAFNQLTLLDYLDRSFVSYETEHFVVRLEKKEAPWLRPYLDPLLDRSWKDLAKRYELDLDSKILLEVFPDLQDFSVRAVAHRFIPASGVTFARVVGLASPNALPPGSHGWGRVLWHELAHVASLERSAHRVPRWLTEGISVFEESKGHKAWVREWDEAVVDALHRGRLLPILELDQGFSKPRFPNQVMLSYYQGGLICRFVETEYGFEKILSLLDGYKEGLTLPKNLDRALGLTPAAFDKAFLAYVGEMFQHVKYRPVLDSRAELGRLRRKAKKNRKDLKAQVDYGLACVDMDRWADAETTAGRIMAIDPQSGDAKLIDAHIAWHRGHKEKAIKLVNAALAAGTSDPLGARLFLARYYARPEDRTSEEPRDARQATKELEGALRLFPTRQATLRNLQELYVTLEETEKAEALDLRIARVAPNDAQVRITLADRALEAGRLEEAADWIEQVEYILPQWPDLHRARAVLGALSGDEQLSADAKQKFGLTLKGSPPPAAAKARAAFDAAIKKAKEARAAEEAGKAEGAPDRMPEKPSPAEPPPGEPKKDDPAPSTPF
jgi:tetratricopeptide (TPR) repeat protein